MHKWNRKVMRLVKDTEGKKDGSIGIRTIGKIDRNKRLLESEGGYRI